MSIDTGGPAFPIPGEDHGCAPRFAAGYGGMALRDYFAAAAMQSIRSGPEWQLLEMKTIAAENSVDVEVVIANFAYRQADAMIKAREAGRGS